MSSELETNGHNDFLAGEVDEYKMRVDDDVGEAVGAELTTGGSGGFLFDRVNVRSSGETGSCICITQINGGCLADSDEGVMGFRHYPQVLVGRGINLAIYSIIYTWSFECKKESYRLCASKFDERNYLSFFASSYEITFVLSL